ncbi:multidrug transporter [Pseudomonas sp. R5(2019)]|uniref:multidrug transporter n=1 Tax=Pseudomonas sp. R5(2019) TaxID=2697566 RepID=UPI001412C990|nr:multidrug transporter [Pseudomonas sp. R5(2019)]NBA94042.1 multidrug transporter [Pseudomonas sp. R5(2019)]
MNPLRLLSLAVALSLTVLVASAQADVAEHTGSGDPAYKIQNPPAFAMFGDLIIARPLLIAATVIGTAAFVVALPFTVAGGNVGASGEALVLDPARAAFVRCLGCTENGYRQSAY